MSVLDKYELFDTVSGFDLHEAAGWPKEVVEVGEPSADGMTRELVIGCDTADGLQVMIVTVDVGVCPRLGPVAFWSLRVSWTEEGLVWHASGVCQPPHCPTCFRPEYECACTAEVLS